MVKDWDLTQVAFDQLLSWLNPDREAAGKRYEEIRRRLVKIFICRSCPCPEDLADETINRVARKVPEIAPTYVGDPAHYFCGVAHNVYLESLRPIPEPEPPPKPDPSDESEEAYSECLERCMGQLSLRNHELVLQYFQGEKRAKIDYRKKLAERLGMTPNALRIKIHRIIEVLRERVMEDLKQRAAG
jgi:DNA-directed RNA polymerase specialized sigma24 family protein